MNEFDVHTLTAENAFTLFADPYRRRLLLTILDHNPEDEAAIPEAIATDQEELEALLVKMHHVHLPKLESHDVIEWDRHKNVVRKGPAFDELRPLLELVDEHRDELPDGWL